LVGAGHCVRGAIRPPAGDGAPDLGWTDASENCRRLEDTQPLIGIIASRENSR
jgi:hypothetical protein